MILRLVLLLSVLLLGACGADDDVVTVEIPTEARVPDTATPQPPTDTPPPSPTATVTEAPSTTLSPTPIPPSATPTRGLLNTSEPIIIPPSLTASPTSNVPTIPVTPTLSALQVTDAPLSSSSIAATDAPATLADLPTDAPPPESAPGSPQGRLELNQTQSADIVQSGETHRYTFLGLAGQRITLGANAAPDTPGDLNPYLRLQSPDGEILAENDDLAAGVADAALTGIELPSTGVYTVYVSSVDETGLGGYLLTLGDAPLTLRDVSRGPAEENAPNDQRLETYGARDIWTVDLAGGDSISVAVEVVELENGLDVMAEVVSPAGESLAFDDDSGANNDAFLSDVSIPADGTYQIRIAAQNNASIGDYRLWWRRNIEPSPMPPPSLTPEPTLPPPSGQVDISLGPGEVFNFRLRAEAGGALNIVLEGQNGFDPVLRVIDPIGNIIVEVDDVNGSLDPRARLDIPETGLYTLQITGFEGQAGDVMMNYILR